MEERKGGMQEAKTEPESRIKVDRQCGGQCFNTGAPNEI
jgi:hypothetical protein